MSVNGGEPAFPVMSAAEWQGHGMTKREVFAMAALQGILANPQYAPPRRMRLVWMAKDAVEAADELLAALSVD